MNCTSIGLFVVLLISHLPDQSYAEDCPTIVKLYHSALKQYQSAQQGYLSSGCQESSEQTKHCKGLEAASREMRSTVEMFAQRARGMGCKPTDDRRSPVSSCERYRSLAQRAQAKIKRLTDQQRAQRCYDRAASSTCRALVRATNQPKELLKAARRSAVKAGCPLDQ